MIHCCNLLSQKLMVHDHLSPRTPIPSRVNLNFYWDQTCYHKEVFNSSLLAHPSLLIFQCWFLHLKKLQSLLWVEHQPPDPQSLLVVMTVITIWVKYKIHNCNCKEGDQRKMMDLWKWDQRLGKQCWEKMMTMMRAKLKSLRQMESKQDERENTKMLVLTNISKDEMMQRINGR